MSLPRIQQAGYANGTPMVRNFLVVHEDLEMRRIIGIVRNTELDADTFRRRLAKNLRIPLSDLSILPEAAPRVAAGESPEQIAKLERQLERYRQLDEINDDDDLADFVNVYRRLLACGRPPKAFLAHAIERFLAASQTLDEQDEDRQDDGGDDEYGEWTPPKTPAATC